MKIALMGLAIGTAIGGCDKPKTIEGEQQGGSCSGQSGCKGKTSCKGQNGCTGKSACTGYSRRNQSSSELQQKREAAAKEMNQ